jgi:hypothetical protein
MPLTANAFAAPVNLAGAEVMAPVVYTDLVLVGTAVTGTVTVTVAGEPLGPQTEQTLVTVAMLIEARPATHPQCPTEIVVVTVL